MDYFLIFAANYKKIDQQKNLPDPARADEF